MCRDISTYSILYMRQLLYVLYLFIVSLNNIFKSSFTSPAHIRNPHPPPTRRSSDLSSALRRTSSPTRSKTLPSCSCCRARTRSEEHTSELQSRGQLVCRLLFL